MNYTDPFALAIFFPNEVKNEFYLFLEYVKILLG